MHKSMFARIVLGVLVLLGLGAVPASAQATRTWVSGVGDDVNPCSRTAPCKTFAGAISKTAARGVISVLDPGGYGAVTITKSISIQTDQGMGGILNSLTAGIVINAGTNDEVFINGLIIDGAGTGLYGIRFLAGKALTLTNCAIRGMKGSPGVGIEVAPTATVSATIVSDCVVTDNNIGVRVQPTGSGYGAVSLDRMTIDRNTSGGIIANGIAASVTLSRSSVISNLPGLSATNSGKIVSFGDNVIVNNSPNGAPTQTLPLQ